MPNVVFPAYILFDGNCTNHWETDLWNGKYLNSFKRDPGEVACCLSERESVLYEKERIWKQYCRICHLAIRVRYQMQKKKKIVTAE